MKKKLLSILFLPTISLFAQTTYDVVVGPGLSYTPEVLTINEGDAVTFTSEGGTHDVNFNINTLTNMSFDNPADIVSLPTQGAGFMGTITFDVPGTYNYDCSVGYHAANGMVGQIIVNAIPSTTVVDIIVNSENHTTLESAVVAADLVTTLSGDGPFTVFAPTDAAFAMIPENVLNSLLADPSGLLTQILLTHVASGNVLSTDLSDGMIVPSLSATSLNISVTDSVVMINDATVTFANIQADNGVVHVIDLVLSPEETNNDDCTDNDVAINTLLGSMGVSDCAAVIDYLATAYDYSTAEACAWDGMPMFDFGGTIAEVCECSCEETGEETNTIVDIIVNSESHTTLETAVIEADLAATLSGEGPFTLFAPTDSAFAMIPEEVLNSLLYDPMGSLTYVLTNHVHAGNVLSTDLSDGMFVPTVAGTNLTVSITELGVFVDGAAVTTADIVADNGVIHVIDAVMVPSDLYVNESLLSEEKSNYLYSIDVLGKRVSEDSTGILIFDVYSSGKVIKRFKF